MQSPYSNTSFKKIVDFNDDNEIIQCVKGVGMYYHRNKTGTGGYPVGSLEHGKAKEVLWPLSHFLQRTATQERKDQLAKEIKAKSPGVIDLLCEGILHPFVVEECGSLRVTDTTYLLLIKSLHAIFMEWSCAENLQLLLIRSGVVSLLFKELKLFSRSLHVNPDSDKLVAQLIQSSSATISNCIQNHCDVYMQLHPDVDVNGTLLPYTRHQNPMVRALSVLTRIQFATYLHLSKPGSVDCPIDIANYISILLEGAKRKDLVVQYLGIILDVTDIITTLQLLCISQNNRDSILSSPNFPFAISCLLSCKNGKVLAATLNLVLALLSPISETIESKIRLEKKTKASSSATFLSHKEAVCACIPDILDRVSSVLQSPNSGSKKLVDATVWTLSHPLKATDMDVATCLENVKTLYENKHYLLALMWSEAALCMLSELPKEKQLLTLYKAFSLYQVYQIEQVLSLRMEDQFDSSTLVFLRQDIYCKAKLVANNLGWVQDKPLVPMPGDALKFLDISLMDVVREINQKFGNKPGSRDSGGKLRCLLCHKHERLVKGHFWPHASLKESSSTSSAKLSFLVKGPSEKHKKADFKTPKGVVFYMLCRNCDNEVLSKEENYFAQHFMHKVKGPEHQVLRYSRSLYRFCLTMLFRGLILQRGIQKCTNFLKIYQTFLKCREMLLNPENVFDSSSLPVVAMFFSPINDESSPVPSTQTDSTLEFSSDAGSQKSKERSTFLVDNIANPALTSDEPLTADTISNSTIAQYLDTNGFSKLSYIPILESKPTVKRNGYFLLVHWAAFSIVLLFEPAYLPQEYSNFLISPEGGLLTVPSNENRLSLTPLGLKTFYRENAINCSSFLLEAPLPNKQPLSLEEGLHHVLKIPLLGDVRKPSSVNLLPAGFIIDRHNSTVQLLPNHNIVLHDSVHDVITSCGATVLLALDEYQKPYALIHYYNPNGLISFGFYVNPKDFSYSKFLPDNKPKQLMQQIAAGSHHHHKFFRELPSMLLPNAIENAGVSSFEALLLHQSSRIILDRKCVPMLTGGGCWYCEFNCEICMKPFSPGYLVHSPEDSTVFKFCGEECRDFSLLHPFMKELSVSADPSRNPLTQGVTVCEREDVNSSFEIYFLRKNIESGSNVGLRGEVPLLCISAVITVENIQMLIDLNLYWTKEDKSKKFVLFLVRSISFQFAGEYYVSEDLHLKEGFLNESVKFEYADIVQKILQLA